MISLNKWAVALCAALLTLGVIACEEATEAKAKTDPKLVGTWERSLVSFDEDASAIDGTLTLMVSDDLRFELVVVFNNGYSEMAAGAIESLPGTRRVKVTTDDNESGATFSYSVSGNELTVTGDEIASIAEVWGLPAGTTSLTGQRVPSQ